MTLRLSIEPLYSFEQLQEDKLQDHSISHLFACSFVLKLLFASIVAVCLFGARSALVNRRKFPFLILNQEHYRTCFP